MQSPTELLKHLGKTMLSLDAGNITVEHAKAQASLVKQSNNLLRYELDKEKFIHKQEQEAKKEG